MNDQPTALRLADSQDCVTDDNCGYCMPCSVAAELRRQHEENEALRRERDLLLGALKSTRAFINSVAPYGGLLERVNAAIKQVEGENT